jgi:predicted nucleic acid-binding protein
MVIISDTTALSNLIKLGKLHYLKEIFHKIIIPKAVYHELIPLKGYHLDLTEIENGDWVQIEIAEKGVLYTELLQ